MSLRNFNAKNNVTAVSAQNAESPLNTAQTLDTKLNVTLDTILKMDWRRETDDNEATGYEEETKQYDLGALSGGDMTFDKLRPSAAAFISAFLLGQVDTVAAGTGFKHTITPTQDMQNPSFTAAQQLGKNIMKRLFMGLHIDAATFTFTKDAWVTAKATVKGTGKFETDIVSETVSGLDNATALTMGTAVLDDDILNVQLIEGELTAGVWTPVTVTGASGTIVTIESLGGGGDPISYKCIYRKSVAWGTMPDEVDESPLRTSDMVFKVGATFDSGTQTISGGRQIAEEANSIEVTINNNLEISFVPSGSGDYATFVLRGGRKSSVTISRRLFDAIQQAKIEANETTLISLKGEGAEFDTGHKFTFWIVLPKVGTTEANIGTDGKFLSENVNMPVFEDATLGSVIIIVKNEVATYAA